MSRLLRVGMLLVMFGCVGVESRGQWGYPRGYGGYGWSQWGNNPNASYMAGLGAYAKGMGQGRLETEKAEAIRRESVMKWNQSVAAYRAKKAVADAKQAAIDGSVRGQRFAADQIARGVTLNALLDQILEFNPDGSKTAAAGAPLPPELIRDIPFTGDSLPMTVCLDEMTGEDGWPVAMQGPDFKDTRAALAGAVDKALAEAAKGPVSDETIKGVNDAIDRLKGDLSTKVGATMPGYDSATIFVTGLAGVTGLLKSTELKPLLVDLEQVTKPIPLGELVRFMHTFNLRFGPATSDRQKEIYQQLAEGMTRLLEDLGKPGEATPSSVAVTMPAAAKEVFQSMGWDELRPDGGK